MSMDATQDLAGAPTDAAVIANLKRSDLNEFDNDSPQQQPHPVKGVQSVPCEGGTLARPANSAGESSIAAAGCVSEGAVGPGAESSLVPHESFVRCATFRSSGSSSEVHGLPLQRSQSTVLSPNAHMAAVSYLDAFHQKQRNQDTYDLRRRHEALDTLKQWQRPPKPSSSRGGETSAGMPRIERAPARGFPCSPQEGPHGGPSSAGSASSRSRQQLVGEMAALFSRLCLGGEQRLLVVYRQKLARLEKQQLHLNALTARLIRSASATRARGTLIKERSFQLQRQLQQQEAAAKAPSKRIPAILRLPLPTFTPSCTTPGTTQQQQQQPLDFWRRLLRRARPARRRASLPSTVGLVGPSSASSAAAVAAAAATAGESSAAFSPGTTGERGGPAGEPAAAAGTAAPEAAAVAAAMSAASELSEAVERFSSSRRRRSLPCRTVDPFFCLQRGGRRRRTAEELLQQAEAAYAAAAAAGAAAPNLCHGSLLQDLHCLSRTLSVEMQQTQQRLHLADMLQQKRPAAAARRGWESAAARLCPLPLREGFSISGPLSGHQRLNAELPGGNGLASCVGSRQMPAVYTGAPFRTPVAVSAAPRGVGVRGPAAAAVAVSVATDVTAVAAAEGSGGAKVEGEVAGAPAAAAGAVVGATWSEEDSSLLEAETDCEYLLGRQLLPYERMLLTYRMLKNKGVGVAAGANGEAQLIEELLQAIGDGGPEGGPSFSLGSEGLPADEDSQRWASWTEDAETDAAKAESLLLLVQELQQADLQQLTHVANAIPTSSKRPMQKEETFLHAFFGEPTVTPDYAFQAPKEGPPDQLGATAEALADVPQAGSPEETPKGSLSGGGLMGPEEMTVGTQGEDGADTGEGSKKQFPTAEFLYRAHYVLGPWRSSLIGNSQQLPRSHKR
ncbi:hypothetical protein, conserved [Eimeria maxima]|uniref:Uncharacterized protein n=1 Tax=Eimeria maxima TaxID=5804 RepID=U6M1U4_EIMMA|nr:hypothetical protein, conserved [Eimeria maxima]CDJ56434.1 hypothetical protein, conserved [Eimeria maxima]